MYKKIKSEYLYLFDVPDNGLYAISIKASCQSGGFLGLFGGEDLRVEIEDIKLREIPAKGKPQYYNIPSAWNGTELGGESKTIIYIIKLDEGEHSIKFIPKNGAIIDEEPVIKPFEPDKSVLDNIQAEDGDRRPWITIALIDLPLNCLDVSVVCEERDGDSDDLKLIIDGQTEKNKKSNWYWQGRQLKGQEKDARFYTSLSKGVHYVELWADRMPTLKKLSFNIKSDQREPERPSRAETDKEVQIYTYKGVSGDEDYNRFDKEIKSATAYWNKVYAEQEYPPEELLNHDLVKAIIYKESRMGYFQSSHHPAYPDVMQVGDLRNPALDALQGGEANEFISKNTVKAHISYNFPADRLPIKIESVEESIFWGIRWLYYKAQISYGSGEKQLIPPITREWKTWEQALIDYNGSNRKQEYQKDIWRIYKEGTDPDGNILWKYIKNGFSRIKVLVYILFGLVLFFLGIHFDDNYYCSVDCCEKQSASVEESERLDSLIKRNELAEAAILEDMKKFKEEKYRYSRIFEDTLEACQKTDCYLEHVVRPFYDDLVANMDSNEHFLRAVGDFDYLSDIRIGDIDNDGENEILFIERDTMNRLYVNIIIIDKVEGEFKLLENKIADSYDAYIELLDITGDIQPEILLFKSHGRAGYPLYVYQYLEDKNIKELAFKRAFVWYPEFVFADINKNGLMDIIMRGEEKDAPRGYFAYVEFFYEYSPDTNSIQQINAKRDIIRGQR